MGGGDLGERDGRIELICWRDFGCCRKCRWRGDSGHDDVLGRRNVDDESKAR